jgi:heat shock protein HslJ
VKRVLFILVIGALAACSPRNANMSSRKVPLLGTWWRVVEVDGRHADFVAGQKMDMYITLSRQGRMNGSGGCNHLDAIFAQSGRNIRFGRIASTRMACSPEIMARERAFIEALRKTDAYEQDERDLRFYDSSGHNQLRFMAVRRP